MPRISAPRRVPLLTMLTLAVAAALLGGPAGRVGPVAYVPAGKPFCLRDTHIPDEAYAVEEFARTHNFTPSPGLKGKSLFADTGHDLPSLLRPYLEYDVFPPVPGAGRPAPRVVLSDKVPYASWYSPDHYESFLLMFPLDCIPNVATLLPRDVFGGGGT